MATKKGFKTKVSVIGSDFGGKLPECLRGRVNFEIWDEGLVIAGYKTSGDVQWSIRVELADFKSAMEDLLPSIESLLK